MASGLPSVNRMSKVTWRPSSSPSSLSPVLSPSTVGWLAANASFRTPMRNGRRASCASTGSARRPTRSATASAAIPGLPSPLRELVVHALGDLVPGSEQRLELRERRIHLLRHGALLGMVPDDIDRDLLEIAQHHRRELDELDLALELCLDSLEGDGVLRVEVHEANDLGGRHGQVEDASEVD